MPNDNIMGIPTKACINGMTKADVERLKNALVKQILNDETVVDVTEDGKIIIANDDGLFLSFDDSVIGLTKDDNDNIIPVADPYIPMDESDNPLAPDNNVIMTSGNIAVDPRIVRTTGNQSISGIKSTTSSLAILSNNMDLDSPPSYTGRTFKEFKVKQGSQVVIREDATLASAGNAHRIIVHAHKDDGTDVSSTLSFVQYRDGTSKLSLIRADGTEVIIVPRA